MFGELRQLAKAEWSPASAIENQDELVTGGEVREPSRSASRIRQNEIRGDFARAEDVGVVHLSDPLEVIDHPQTTMKMRGPGGRCTSWAHFIVSEKSDELT